MGTAERSDTELVLAARNDGGEAFGELFNRWFNSSWNVARNIVRQDDLAADVAQDALLTAWQRLDQLDNPEAFGGWLLRITRNRALTRLEREQRSKATGDDVVSGLRDKGLPDPTGAERPLSPDSISEVRDRQELVWAASAALGEKEASLLDLHLRHGLSPAEIAEELGVEANNAHQQLYRLRTKLGDAIGSYLLWRNGRPLCDGLANAVSGDVAFDKSVARAVVRHQKSCDHCSERRASLVDPSKLFAAIPMVLVPTQLKLQAAAGLQSAGVSFGSSSGSNTADGSGGSDGASGPDGSGSTGSDGSASTGSGGGDGGSGLDRFDAAGGPDGASGTGGPSGSSGSSGSGGGQGGSGGTNPHLGHQLENAGAGSNPGSGAGGSIGSGGALPVAPMVAGPGSAAGFEMSAGSKKAVLVGAGTATVAVIIALFLWIAQGPDDSVAAIGSETGNDLADLELSSSEGAAGDEAGETAELAPAAPSAGDSDENDPDVQTPGADDPTTTAGLEREPADEDDDPVTTRPPAAVPEEEDPLPEVTQPPRDPTPPTPEVTDPPREPDPPEEPDPPGDPDPDPPGDDGSTTEPTPPTPPPPPPPPPPPLPPEIIRFTKRRPAGPLLCADSSQGPFEAIWTADNTDSVSLRLPNGTSRSGSASGSYKFCGTTGDVIRLVATGPGGTAESTVTL